MAAGCGDDDGVEHFSIAIRGGAWTAVHLGVVFDEVRAAASTAHVKKYCGTHHLPPLKLYGEATCTILAKFRVFRMRSDMELARSCR